MARITLAGESLIAQKQGTQQLLQIARFIYANVPGLNPQTPVDRTAGKPPANQIVHTYVIPQENSGYVNPNQVVYSSMLGSDIGDFDFNWLGLESEEGVLFAVAYLPLQQKRKNIPPLQIGNNVTRNILVEYSGAQELTGISIDARTWQHDFTVRLKGIDERERLSNRDMYGRACFHGDGLQVEKVDSGYQLKAGLAYIEGIRVALLTPLAIAPTAMPTTVWLRVALRRQLSDVVASWSVTYGDLEADYTDSDGAAVYAVAIASLTSSKITDLRLAEPISAALVKHFARQAWVQAELDKKVNKGTTLADYGITDAIPNINPLPSGSLDLHGGRFVFATSEFESSLSQNCYFNGTNWVRHDVTKPAVCISASNGTVLVRKVGAGDNPIVWATTATSLDTSNILFSHLRELPATVAGHGITDVDTKVQAQARVDAASAAILGAVPAALNTLAKLAAAVNNDPAFSATVLTQLSQKANKGTTLADYGIGDAIQNKNPLPSGSLDLHGGNFAFVTAALESTLAQNCYWDGANWLRHDITKPSVYVSASNGTVLVRRAAAGANPINWTSTATALDTSNILFSHLRELPATVAGHGITDVDTKVQAQARVDAASAAILGAVPAALNTLAKLAAAVNNDPAFSATVLTQLSQKANKGTTLADYGIGDAIQNKNPLPSGSLDLHGDRFAFVTSPQETNLAQNCYWDGTNWMRHDTSKPAVCVVTAAGEASIRKAAAGANPIVWSSMQPILDLGMEATQAEAEVATSGTKWMSPRRAWQAMTKWLSSGFTSYIAGNGYIAFPSWLGGLVIQWGQALESANTNEVRGFPIAFPEACFVVLPVLNANSAGGYGQNSGTIVGNPTRTGFVVSSGGAWDNLGQYFYIAIGK
ncbi:phage tail protein [Pseudomonas asiatica]|uniref:phage tail protein n=1 Tax=Pseudomonas asiatica TaxID=2219225 RepID=UPI000EE7403D|nr:hypothetical protein D0O09_13100 [Pseudomonas putida]